MRFKLLIEYNGSNYSGWQKQPGQKETKTIQGTLINAVKAALSNTKGKTKFTDLQGSGRTDTGVHAYGQVAHLDCETMLSPEILMMKINDELPTDINILSVKKASNSFHARHDAKSRQYVYQISKRRTALEKRYVWWIKDKIDTSKMKEAAKLFVGMHDFASFSDSGSEDDDKSTKCLVEMIEVTVDKDKIYIRINASHFLWKMVRRIVGMLVEVSRIKKENEEGSRLNIDDINTFLKTRSDIPAKYTAPPSGLFLEKVEY